MLHLLLQLNPPAGAVVLSPCLEELSPFELWDDDGVPIAQEVDPHTTTIILKRRNKRLAIRHSFIHEAPHAAKRPGLRPAINAGESMPVL